MFVIVLVVRNIMKHIYFFMCIYFTLPKSVLLLIFVNMLYEYNFVSKHTAESACCISSSIVPFTDNRR